jgi:hypothetical protein
MLFSVRNKEHAVSDSVLTNETNPGRYVLVFLTCVVLQFFKGRSTLLCLFGYFTQPEASYVAFSSFSETRVCGTKVQPILV